MVMRLLVATALALAVPCAVRAEDCRARLTPGPVVDPPGSRAIEATDLIELRDFGFPDSLPVRAEIFALSPDGTAIALQLRRADAAANSFCTGVVIVDVASGAARLVDVGGEPILMRYDVHGMADRTIGAPHAPPPAWSPDGRTLVFLRRDHGVTRLWRVASAGGAAQPLAGEGEDIRAFAWEADGRALRIATRPSVAFERAEIAREGRSGYHYDRRFWALSDAAPSPSGDDPVLWQRIDAISGALLAGPVAAPVGPAGGAVVEAVAASGARAWTAPTDARRFLGLEPLSIRRGGHVTHCADASCMERVRGLWWEPDGSLLVLRDWGNDRAGRLELFRWRAGRALVSVYATSAVLLDCQYRAYTLVCAHEASTRPRTIVALNTRTARLRTLYDPNPEFAGVRTGQVERLVVHADDGAPAFADLVLPPDHEAGQRHPLIVVQYQSRGFLRGGTGDEYPVHLLAARGYAVLSYNRPAPFGGGAVIADADDFERINVTGWADRRRTFSGLEAAVDAAIARGVVDPARLGITGLSEGAASAIWAIANTHRYRAAALSGCCEEPSTTRFAAGPEYLRKTMAWGYPGPGEDKPAFWAPYSLAQNAARVTTPILLQAADSEFRLALETVATLDHAGTPVDFYVFPDEYHIKWQPAHRLAIYDRVVDWFDFWLRGRIDPDPAKAKQYDRWQAMRARAER